MHFMWRTKGETHEYNLKFAKHYMVNKHVHSQWIAMMKLISTRIAMFAMASIGNDIEETLSSY